MKEQWSDLLIRSLDQPLSADEEKALEAALHKDEALREEKQQLEEMRAAVQSLQLAPSTGFAESVMTKLEADRTGLKNESIIYSLGRIYLRVAVACVLLIGLALASIYWSEGSISSDPLVDADMLTPEEIVALIE